MSFSLGVKPGIYRFQMIIILSYSSFLYYCVLLGDQEKSLFQVGHLQLQFLYLFFS